MSALLTFKVTALRALTGCPLCGSIRQDFWKSPEHFDDAKNASSYLPHAGDKVAAKYFCGLELGISRCNEIVARQHCTQIGKETATELDEKAEGDLDEQQERNAA